MEKTTNIDKRAIVPEATKHLKRAIMEKTTIFDERAIVKETTRNQKRAINGKTTKGKGANFNTQKGERQ